MSTTSVHALAGLSSSLQARYVCVKLVCNVEFGLNEICSTVAAGVESGAACLIAARMVPMNMPMTTPLSMVQHHESPLASFICSHMRLCACSICANDVSHLARAARVRALQGTEQKQQRRDEMVMSSSRTRTPEGRVGRLELGGRVAGHTAHRHCHSTALHCTAAKQETGWRSQLTRESRLSVFIVPLCWPGQALPVRNRCSSALAGSTPHLAASMVESECGVSVKRERKQ